MENKTKIVILAAVLVVVVLVVWAMWFRGAEVVTPAGELGAELLEKNQNPIKDEIAETNPFKAEANPFAKELNPYEGVYQNPFE